MRWKTASAPSTPENALYLPMHPFLKTFSFALFGMLMAGCGTTPTSPAAGPPYAPEDALSTFEIADGFKIELVAAEPLVQDPVAMTVDEGGHIYVVEMPGYPLDLGRTGRVKRLMDTDGDGQPDQSVLFADDLALPTGIMRWKNGVIVADPPEILYFEDTDGDGQADVREVMLTGFALSNPQHNANNPRFGLDGWIYLANGETTWWTTAYPEFATRGNEIYFPSRPDGPRLGLNGFDRNVRFRPDTFEMETRSGASQFGHTFDAWGHHFLVDNSHHQYHEVLDARYFFRNPDLPVRSATHDTPVHGRAAVVYPITVDPVHQLLTDRGIFTSACGLTYYLGGAFPEQYDNTTFVAEPVHNLVHVDQVTPDGATFSASRLFEGREFLASTDSWFRPVNLHLGPDGALYLIDYYREIVEHPEWMDDETIASGNLYNGADRGRIYRIVPEDAAPVSWTDNLDLGEASTATLVETLSHPNAWWRLHAQRLLLDQKVEAAPELLIALLQEPPSPEALVHALWTLHNLGRLEPTHIEAALRNDIAGVRENATLLAELHLAEEPTLSDALLTLANDPDARVRFQLLNTLGELNTTEANATQQRLLAKDIEDEWTQVAALLALPDDHSGLFDATIAQLGDQESEGRITYIERIASMIGRSEDHDVIQGVAATAANNSSPSTAWWRAAALTGLAQGLASTLR